jgi:hypothetical protein
MISGQYRLCLKRLQSVSKIDTAALPERLSVTPAPSAWAGCFSDRSRKAYTIPASLADGRSRRADFLPDKERLGAWKRVARALRC